MEQLATLAGKKLQAKRNHINRFVERFPHWYTRPLDGQTREDCQALARRWYEDREEIRGLSTERAALTEALERYDILGMEGLVLYDGEKAVGFSLGNRITPEIYDVNFEKADPEVPGAYPLINREFSRRIAESYPQVRLLNREDDMGLEGLRKAKESYNPMMLEKMTAVWEG